MNCLIRQHHARWPSKPPTLRCCRRPDQHSSATPSHQHAQFRPLSLLRPKFRGRHWTWPQLSRHVVRHEPALLALGALASALAVMALYRTARRKQLARRLGTFPPKVGIYLDRAIYFSHHDPDPAKAMDAFSSALRAAAELGMDPLSNEVIGVKVELAKSLEKQANFPAAIAVLEDLKASCLASTQEPDQNKQLLAWACRISTRLADLYADPRVGNDQKMEESLVWAVETTLKERRRRQSAETAAAQQQEPWLDDDEIGSQLESMAHMYEERNHYFYASQLFLHALNIKPKKDCHAVFLMNNLAACLAQQSPPAEPGLPPASPSQLRESGKAWALQALTLSQGIQAPDRDSECDIGCVVATHNLGEFAETEGNISEARERYEQAASLAHAFRFEEGLANANEGLRRIRASAHTTSTSRRPW